MPCSAMLKFSTRNGCMFRCGWLPPTAFLEQPDAACKLRHVPLRAERMAPPQAVMSNSFAFGGSNVVLVASRA